MDEKTLCQRSLTSAGTAIILRQIDNNCPLQILAKSMRLTTETKEECRVDSNAPCKKIEAWVTAPHGFAKPRFADLQEAILFDRAVTAQLHCPKKVQLAAYSTPALIALDANEQVCGDEAPHAYRYLPSKKEILAYAARVAEKVGPDVPFDIVTRDALYCFENGRARIGGMQPDSTGEFSSVVVYRHRPRVIP
jgi:hypothetical protein